MSRYIDADKAIEALFNDAMFDYPPAGRAIIDDMKTVPTADVVEVVRCKDCRHYDNKNCKEGFGYCMREQEDGFFYNALHGVFKDNDFCSYGERKEQEQ